MVVLRTTMHGTEREAITMAIINKNELTQEQIQKALACENADELMALAKAEGLEITKAEAEAYMKELSDFELDEEKLKQLAGGCADCKDAWYH